MSGNFDESGKNGPENLPAIVKSAILAKKLHRGAPLPTHLNIQQTLTNFLPNSSFLSELLYLPNHLYILTFFTKFAITCQGAPLPLL